MAPPTFHTFWVQNENLYSCSRGTLLSQVSCKLNMLQNLMNPKYIINKMFMFNRTFSAKMHFISKCRRKNAGCLSAVYALMVDWQQGVRMARPLLYRNFLFNIFDDHPRQFIWEPPRGNSITNSTGLNRVSRVWTVRTLHVHLNQISEPNIWTKYLARFPYNPHSIIFSSYF